MRRLIFLDSTPLGILSHPKPEQSSAITNWVIALETAGCRIVVPAIIYYEVRREFLRAGLTRSLRRLEAFAHAEPGRYLSLTDGALDHAATLWADARRRGRPTGDPKGLDIDVILASQALSLGTGAIVATSNVKHLQQFCDATHWTEIQP
ncbi:hypothetical protein F183_A07220 [Bryobacterales bacterium F-183]|nr:hypothetical protein F183_A07220 [Bryobacterales bacterium F-183]